MQWVFGSASQFGPISPCTGSNYYCGNWCLNNQPAGCPDVVPALGLDYALRINCEVPSALMPYPRNSNLQAFLVLANAPPPQPGTQSLTVGQGARSLQMASQLLIPWYLGTEADFVAGHITQRR